MTLSFLNFYLFILGCAGSSLLHELFASYGEQGLLSSCGARSSHCSGFSGCKAQTGSRGHGLQDLWLPGVWDLPGSGIEPVSPALAGS